MNIVVYKTVNIQIISIYLYPFFLYFPPRIRSSYRSRFLTILLSVDLSVDSFLFCYKLSDISGRFKPQNLSKHDDKSILHDLPLPTNQNERLPPTQSMWSFGGGGEEKIVVCLASTTELQPITGRMNGVIVPDVLSSLFESRLQLNYF